ncbi:NB-ARC domains-containing protein [Artemisia annua]|uniref:NB-ARC domains-containing protein n=1 Tax=Artemisia annua TaxID=35608 RepID=A0A2U1NK90_ARTAN|nr:NB-ARC domains-containing protein [Artemisia annua]
MNFFREVFVYDYAAMREISLIYKVATVVLLLIVTMVLLLQKAISNAMKMEFVSAILGPVVNTLTAYITKKLRNLTSSVELVERMKNKMQNLEERRDDIEEHVRDNQVSNRKIPTHVPRWLEDVKNIKEKVDKISSNNVGCFNVKKKYKAGEDALKLTEVIEGLIKDSKDITWSDVQIPLGRVNSKSLASTLASGGNIQNVFNSRVKTFNDALKLLQQADGDKTRIIALCGMGGVGKTTMMKQLKEVAHDKKMFNWIVDVVIGKTPNLFAIQKAIAAHTGEPLTETVETLRATYLSKRYQVFSERKEKSLVILDDVWEKIKLEDIGLASPLPKGVKLLLTSRDVKVCQQIAVDAESVLEIVTVDVLKEGEARDFFSQITGVSEEHDRDLYQIGCDIVKKCGGLPLAIKLIAATLISQEKFVWSSTLKHLKKNNLVKNVQEIIEISYKKLKRDEDRAIFLLCGLFPEDSNIPIEDLTRYAWGLKLLKQVSTMEDARESTQTSVSNLKNAYLLMDGDSDDYECVKVHDLVLAFVVNTVSKGGEDGCWIIHHNDFSKWSEANSMSQSCKQISLACKGMSEFPSEFKFPNLLVLKLMQGDESLRFPQDFYVGMGKLQVIAFEKLEYPLVPTSFQCSTNLRTLCLNECSLTFDLTCIGNLSNLEVLSFANSGITVLPSTIGNLKKLRLLDVSGSYFLVIDDGVLKNLVKLEELYMIGFDTQEFCFTDNNFNELAERSENLSALEFEFISVNAHMKNMSFKKLKRFKLSVGCYFTEVDWWHRSQRGTRSYQNCLKLITNREELLNSKINELFKITNALYLQVNDMNTLEDVDVESPHPQHSPRNSSFYNLRFLVVSECAKLKYLFTLSVATHLSKLEYLKISRCATMEAVIHSKNNGSDIIKFLNLKYLHIAELPKLLCFCNNVNIIELPRLVELQLGGLQNFTSIYPSNSSSSASSTISRMQSFFHEEDATPMLEKLFVSYMKNLKEIWPPQFSSNNLYVLRELMVKDCHSIEFLFSMDFGEIEHLSSSLRSITVEGCDSLVKLFSCNPFPFLNNLQELQVSRCGSIQVLFDIDSGRTGNIGEQICTSSLRSIVVSRCVSLVKLFSCNPFPFLNNLQELKVRRCGSIRVLFDVDSGRAGEIEEQVCSSSLRSIVVSGCDSLVNLLPNNPMTLFNHLEELEVRSCACVQVIFDIDMGCVGEMAKVSSSRLRSICLGQLRNLRDVWRIKDAGNNLIHGFEAVESIFIQDCERFENIITPATTNFDMRALKQVQIINCGVESKRNTYWLWLVYLKGLNQKINVIPTSMEEVNAGISKVALPYLENLHLEKLWRMSHVWKCDWNEFLILQKPQSQSSFHNLTTITMKCCPNIKYLFSPLMAKLLSNLKKVDIWLCDSIEEVVSNRDDEDTSLYSHIDTSFFPHFDVLNLSTLKNFKCIGGGAENVSTDIHGQLKLSQVSWSLCQYSREISIEYCNALSSVIPWYAVGQMQKLQVLKIINCKAMTEVFETQEMNNKSGTDTGKSLLRLEYITMLKLPKLKILNIQGCHLLKHIFTFSTLESLTQLEELEVKDCKAMEVIVTEEKGEQTTTSVVVDFPHLKSLTLVNLPNFVGFFLGKNEFIWPALEKVVIVKCPQITVFTYGRSTAPKLNFINTSLGKHSVECGLNFRVTTTSHQRNNWIESNMINKYQRFGYARLRSYESTSSYRPTTMGRLPWSYHNLIEVDMDYDPRVGQSLFSSDEVSQLQKLETVHCARLDIEEIFDSQIVAEIRNLRELKLEWLKSLKYIWKSKQGTALKFPNLTQLSIHRCGSLEYVFTCSMVGSLLQLQELHISECHMMKVIVKGEEEESDAIVNAIVEFPCLKSLKLFDLTSLEGFCIGKEAFEFPSLDTFEIDDWCQKMRVFTKGDLSTPKLHAIHTEDGKFVIHNRLLNSFI